MSPSDVRSTRKIAVLAPLFPPAFRGGGPIRSIYAMVRSAPGWADVDVITSDRDLGATQQLDVKSNAWVPRDGYTIRYTSTSSLKHFLNAMRALRARRPRLLHMNSFFTPVMTIIPLALWRVGFWGNTILLVAPRGEFGAAALARHSRRKRLYIRLFRFLGGHNAVIWHSTAPHETDAIRAVWGQTVRIVERENDTMLPATARQAEQRVAGPIRAVFLGRIVEHKGLHVVLEALKDMVAPVSLDIFGLRENPSYYSECLDIAKSVPGHVRVTFHDSVAPDDVRATLQDFDVLLMPTAGENFGHVIAEALSVSCIVAATPYTPWNEVLIAGDGIVVPDRSVEQWTSALDALSKMGDQEIISRRNSSGRGYSEWQARAKSVHVWELAFLEAGAHA